VSAYSLIIYNRHKDMKIFLPLLFVFTLLSGCNDRPALLSSGFKYIVHTRGKGPKGKANDLALMCIQIRNDTGVLVSRLDLSAIPDTMFTCAKLVKKVSNKELAWQKTSSTS
jgi:hypothetical protein